jgi:hypothetical protein
MEKTTFHAMCWASVGSLLSFAPSSGLMATVAFKNGQLTDPTVPPPP